MNKVVLVASLLMLLAVSPVVMAGDEEIVAMVQSTTEQVLKRFKSKESELKQHPERIYDTVANIIEPKFDFEEMTRSAMGKYWRQASSQEQKDVTREFGELLIRTYGSALLNYSGKPIKYGEPRRSKDGKRVLVPSDVTAASGSVVPINYFLHQVAGAWKVLDVKIEGISLSANYRTSFASEIRSGGVSGLIDKLKERNKSLGG